MVSTLTGKLNWNVFTYFTPMFSDPQLPLALREIFNIWPGARLNIEILHCDSNKN